MRSEAWVCDFSLKKKLQLLLMSLVIRLQGVRATRK
jgi:hypothetical protein